MTDHVLWIGLLPVAQRFSDDGCSCDGANLQPAARGEGVKVEIAVVVDVVVLDAVGGADADADAQPAYGHMYVVCRLWPDDLGQWSGNFLLVGQACIRACASLRVLDQEETSSASSFDEFKGPAGDQRARLHME